MNHQQFVHDMALVIDNDYEAYTITRNAAKSLNNVHEVAEMLRDFVETRIDNAIKTDTDNAIGAMLIREICNGYGIDAYADYARDIMAELSESAGV